MILFRHLTPAVWTATLLGAALPQATWAAAPSAAERAFATFEAGEAAFRAEDFERAARLFAEAFAVHAEPAYLFNQGLALARGERLRQAEAVYLSFIDSFAANERLEVVQNHLAEVRARIAERAVTIAITTVPTGAMARLVGSDAPDATCTTPCELKADPGPLTVEIANELKRIERTRNVAAGARWDLSVDLMRGPEVKPTPPDRTPAWASWSLGAAGLVTGVVLGVVASGAHDDAAALAASGPLGEADYASFQRSKADARDLALGADISFGVAVTGAIVGTVFWLLGDSASDEPTGDGAMAWRF